jgi:hypothetical protein
MVVGAAATSPGCPIGRRRGDGMVSWNDLTWVEAMQQAFEAVGLSEQL